MDDDIFEGKFNEIADKYKKEFRESLRSVMMEQVLKQISAADDAALKKMIQDNIMIMTALQDEVKRRNNENNHGAQP